jgi:aspartyl-tRNA(Asn)/glutamyl-tRNA(Gln) amidotransferase subunit A
MTDLVYLSGAEQGRLIQSRKISPVELVRAYLDRIDKFDSVLRAWINVRPELALEKARQAEDEISRGAYRGPLHGLPYGVKDQIHAMGFPTTLGTRVLDESETLPPHDATVIERLDAAGAILLGKQNLHEFGKGGTIDFPFGQPRNPWHPRYTASSSSSGSGIAPAAGMCTFSLGEDTGGSIRGPASCNGVVGLRPTYGRVSRFGGVMEAYTSDTIGPLARTVEDVANILHSIAGGDPGDPLSSTRPVSHYAEMLGGGIKGMRLGIVREIAWGRGTSAEVQDAFRRAVEVLQGLGAEVTELSLPWVGFSVPLLLLSTDADVASWFLKKYLRDRYGRFDVGTRTRLAAATLIPATVYNRAMRARALVRKQVLDALRECDALICPTNVTAPKPIEANQETVSDDKDDVVARLIERRISLYPFSLANVPAVSVPAGFSKEGLPLALQIAGRPFAEATILRVAHAYERATEWHLQHPDLQESIAKAA